MRKVFSLFAMAACVAVVVSCENRMVPSDVDKIPGSESVYYALPLYEQQDRIMGALDRLVGEMDVTKFEDAVNAIGVTGRAFDRLPYAKSSAVDSAQLATLLKTFIDIFNAFTTGTGDNLKTLYDITQLQGNWTLNSTGITFAPANGVLNVNVADSAIFNVVFSKKVKEYYIGKCEVPVKLGIGTKESPDVTFATLPLTEEVYAQTYGAKKGPVTVIPQFALTDLTARIPVGAEATLSIAGATAPAFTAAITLDGSFSEPFVANYVEPQIQIEKLLNELGIDFGFVFQAGGYSLTIAKVAWSGGNAKIISAISKDGKNLLTEHFTLSGYKLNREKFEYYAKLLGGGDDLPVAADSIVAEVAADSLNVVEAAADSVVAEMVEEGVAGIILRSMSGGLIRDFGESVVTTDTTIAEEVVYPVEGPDRKSMLKALVLPILGGDFNGADLDVDILGYFQFKANLGASSQIDDIVKYFMDAISKDMAAELAVSAGEVESGLDSTTAFQYRERVNDYLKVGLYFGSDVRQSHLVLSAPRRKSESSWGWKAQDALWIVSDAVPSEDVDKMLRTTGGRSRDMEYLDAQPVQAFFTGTKVQAWMEIIMIRLRMAFPGLFEKEETI